MLSLLTVRPQKIVVMSLDPATDVYSPLRVGNSDGVDVAHDVALVRASHSHHKIAKCREKPRRTVFVWGMSHKTKEEEIKEFFAKYGEVRSVVLIRDVVTRISKGYAFVEYDSSKAALRAVEKADGASIASRPVRCQMKVGGVLEGWRPRRLGGGFGGRKESGQMRFGGRATPFSKQGILTAREEKSIQTVPPSECGSSKPTNSESELNSSIHLTSSASLQTKPARSEVTLSSTAEVEVSSRGDERDVKTGKRKKDKKKKHRKDKT